MFDDLLQNLFLNAKNQINEQKKELGGKVIDFISSDEKINIKINGNFEILDLKISADLMSEPIEIIEDLLVVNLNKAIKKIHEIREKQMTESVGNVMPDLNSVFDMFDDVDENTDTQESDNDDNKNDR